jgi:hypothetical protein
LNGAAENGVFGDPEKGLLAFGYFRPESNLQWTVLRYLMEKMNKIKIEVLSVLLFCVVILHF